MTNEFCRRNFLTKVRIDDEWLFEEAKIKGFLNQETGYQTLVE